MFFSTFEMEINHFQIVITNQEYNKYFAHRKTSEQYIQATKKSVTVWFNSISLIALLKKKKKRPASIHRVSSNRVKNVKKKKKSLRQTSPQVFSDRPIHNPFTTNASRHRDTPHVSCIYTLSKWNVSLQRVNTHSQDINTTRAFWACYPRWKLSLCHFLSFLSRWGLYQLFNARRTILCIFFFFTERLMTECLNIENFLKRLQLN